MSKWIKGTKTLDLNVKINMDAWRQRVNVNLIYVNYLLIVRAEVIEEDDPAKDRRAPRATRHEELLLRYSLERLNQN